MLNPDSPIPLYHQLADIICARIRSGRYLPGERIPSEHRLAADFGVARPTARQANDLLVRKRILERKRGSGTYVRKEREEMDLFSLAGTLTSFHKTGAPFSTLVLERVRQKQIEEDDENPFSGRTAWFFSRLSRVEKDPVLLEELFLDPDIFPDLDRFDPGERSLSQIVAENYHMLPSGGKQNFRIGYLKGKSADDLAVDPDTPILLVKRLLNFQKRPEAVFSIMYCRTDRFIFSQTIGETGGFHE